jgi:ABC-type Fe3+ transport system substrate-binding protein
MKNKSLLTILTVCLLLLSPALVFPASTPTNLLAQVIEAARAEGEAIVRIHPEADDTELARLSSEIEETFGVKLKLTQSYVGSPPAETSKLFMELQTGVTPHLDVMWGSISQPFDPNYAAITKKIDWHALLDNDLARDINPAAIKDTWPVPTLSWGDASYDIAYRTDKLSFDEVPNTYTGFADPKLRGKIGIAEYSTLPPQKAFLSGDKEEVYSGLKAALKNDPIVGRYGDLVARLELGEIWLAQTVSHRVGLARAHGVPLGYKFMYNTVALDAYSSIVVKNCAHPNAATLVILYLSTPRGSKWTAEAWYAGNSYYPTNWFYENIQKLKAGGGGVKDLSTWKEYIDFMNSDEYAKWHKEASSILVRGK